jgi:hypothetical protein
MTAQDGSDLSQQAPEDLPEDTVGEQSTAPKKSGKGLTAQQRRLLIRLLRVAYPHDRFPDAPYERTAKRVEEETSDEELDALAAGLDALDADAFLDLDEDAATAALRAVDQQPFFRQVHSTAVVALYDDREVWDLLGYEGSSFEKGGYIDRGFDDLDWLPEPRITEADGSRVEIVSDEARS